MKLVPVDEFNLGDLRALGFATYKEHFSDIWTSAGMDTYLEKSFELSRLHDDLEAGQIKYFLIEADVKFVGFMKICLDRYMTPGSLEPGIELEKIYLLRQYAGRGIGSAAFGFLCDYARKRNESVIWLNVLKNNQRAISFYERFGFKKVDELDFSTDKVRVDMWVMKFEL